MQSQVSSFAEPNSSVTEKYCSNKDLYAPERSRWIDAGDDVVQSPASESEVFLAVGSGTESSTIHWKADVLR